MKRWFQIDERGERVNERVSTLLLGLTQLALVVALVAQRYGKGLASDYYQDVGIILILSVLGYWGARSYFGGLLPVVSWRPLLLVYLMLVVSIGVPHTLLRGWPGPGEWWGRLLAILGGPALLVAAYGLLAHLGNKRIEGQINGEVDEEV